MSFFRRSSGRGARSHDPATLRRGPGALVLSPDERLDRLYPYPSRADRMPIEWARELVGPGDVAWDVGAEEGVFGLAAAVLAGPKGSVLAIEPHLKRAERLRKLAENLGAPDSRYDVLEATVVDRTDGAGAPEPERGRAIEATLDSLLMLYRPPTVLRIHERIAASRALFGAKRILLDRQPVVLIDVPPNAAGSIGPRLRGLGYELFDASVNPNDRLKLIDPPRHTLAVPKFTPRD